MEALSCRVTPSESWLGDGDASERSQSVTGSPEGTACAPETLASPTVRRPSPAVEHCFSVRNSLVRTAHRALTCHKGSIKYNCPTCSGEKRAKKNLKPSFKA